LPSRISEGIGSVVRRSAAPAASGGAPLPRAPLPSPGGEGASQRASHHPPSAGRRDVATIYGIEGLLAGRTLMGRYRIEEVIGRGGMGAVYRARDLHLSREVAVKVITVAAPDREAHQRLRARFQREARAAAALHHPAVVAVHDYGTDPELGLDFLVMELLLGEDLASRLQRKGPPATRTAVSILEQAARGLAAGHRAGLVHRDVKPGNLFLESGDRAGDLRVKVLDFGIADLSGAGDDTMTKLTVFGRSPYSPAYASPEQLRGEPRLTAASDVFSLGAVGFQLLTGRRLFSSADPRQMASEVIRSLDEERARLAALPAGLAETLRRALALRPTDRFPNAAAFADALADTVEHAKAGTAEATPERSVAARTQPPAAPTGCDDHTQLLTGFQPSRAATELHAMQQLRTGPPPASARPAAAPIPAAAASGGWARGAGGAPVWFFFPTPPPALFGAAWFLAFTGLRESSFEMVYGGTALSVLATPFALHRLMGRRGSFAIALFASVAGTIGCIYWLGGTESIELVLGTVFAAQLLLCVMVERLTGARGERDATLP
jgi:serine/threonine protein kinase